MNNNTTWTVLGTLLMLAEKKWGARLCCFGQCRPDERYPEKYKGSFFFPFPKPKQSLEDCKAWFGACGQHTWCASARLGGQSCTGAIMAVSVLKVLIDFLSYQVVCLESGRSRVQITLAMGFFSGLSHTSDLKIGTPVATLLGAWHCRVSAGTGRPAPVSECFNWVR